MNAIVQFLEYALLAFVGVMVPFVIAGMVYSFRKRA